MTQMYVPIDRNGHPDTENRFVAAEGDWEGSTGSLQSADAN